MSLLAEPRPAQSRMPVDEAPAPDPLERIRRAARVLASGTLSPPQARHMACEIERLVGLVLRDQPRRTVMSDSRLERLSTREVQVLSALAAGETVQEVAHRLNRSPKTINNQRTNVLRKLGLRNTAELTRFAIQTGLITV